MPTVKPLNQESGSSFTFIKWRSLFNLREICDRVCGGERRSLFGLGKGDLALSLRGDQLFTPYAVLHNHPQDDKSSLDMKNYDV